MARKKRNRSEQRDHTSIASPPAVRYVPKIKSVPLLSDRRLFHPAGDLAPVFSPKRAHKRIVENVVQRPRNTKSRARNVKRSAPTRFAFSVPKKVELCVRRHKRREVLFAMRRTGKGSRALRRRRNYWTGVSCK